MTYHYMVTNQVVMKLKNISAYNKQVNATHIPLLRFSTQLHLAALLGRYANLE
ncbi:hypothetical protein NBRC116493_02480 [Aurantivibrio infirmus]